MDGLSAPAESLETLVSRTLALYHATRTEALKEKQKAKELVAKATSELEKQGAVLAFETKRADKAEAELRGLKEKYSALQQGAATRLAQVEMERDFLQLQVANHVSEERIQSRRDALVREELDGMILESSRVEDHKLAAVLLEATGLRDKEGTMEVLERAGMHQEEIATKLAAVLANRPASKKEGKGGKKGGRRR